MKIRSFLTRDDVLMFPERDEEFRYENGWPFLEIKKNGQTVKLVSKVQILEMEIEPQPMEQVTGIAPEREILDLP